MYFKDLNYSLANEDTRIERELLSQYQTVLAVSGSGARVLPLLKNSIARMDVVDISPHQLKLAELRYCALKNLDLDLFQELLGYRQSSRRRQLILDLPLSQSERNFWLEMQDQWSPSGFLFLGRWERHLRELGRWFRRLFNLRFEELFELNTENERRSWMQKNWPRKRLNLFLQAFANPWVFNLLLYRGQFAQGAEPFPQFLMKVFEKNLVEKDPKKSFFFQMLFLGDLKYAEGFPLEAQPEIYRQSQLFQGEIRFLQADLITQLNSRTYQFASLSDVPSYFDSLLIQKLEQCLVDQFQKESSCWVARSFLKHPLWNSTLNPWSISGKNRWAEECDTTGVYKFHIFENLNL